MLGERRDQIHGWIGFRSRPIDWLLGCLLLPLNSHLTLPSPHPCSLTNRVIAGMLLYQTRTNDTNCSDSKFNQIQQTCTGPTTLKAFGVDPVFKSGTGLYNPDYDDIANSIVTNFYDCTQVADSIVCVPSLVKYFKFLLPDIVSTCIFLDICLPHFLVQLVTATYNISILNQTVNPYPYCAELFNPEQLPYAFYYFPLKDKGRGFPAYFDINLGASDSANWLSYLQQGLYLDQHTSELTVELITYNAPLRIFGYLEVDFSFTEGGSIKVHMVNWFITCHDVQSLTQPLTITFDPLRPPKC